MLFRISNMAWLHNIWWFLTTFPNRKLSSNLAPIITNIKETSISLKGIFYNSILYFSLFLFLNTRGAAYQILLSTRFGGFCSGGVTLASRVRIFFFLNKMKAILLRHSKKVEEKETITKSHPLTQLYPLLQLPIQALLWSWLDNST